MDTETLEEVMLVLEERGVISEDDAVYTVTEAKLLYGRLAPQLREKIIQMYLANMFGDGDEESADTPSVPV